MDKSNGNRLLNNRVAFSHTYIASTLCQKPVGLQ